MIIKILQVLFLLILVDIASANAENLKTACMEQGLKLEKLANEEDRIAEDSLTKEGNATPKALNASQKSALHYKQALRNTYVHLKPEIIKPAL